MTRSTAGLSTTTLLMISLALASGLAQAKLPAASDDAKAKAAEAKAKADHGGKLANFQLCQSMNKSAEAYFSAAKKAGKTVAPALDTPACADPGPFAAAAPAAEPAKK